MSKIIVSYGIAQVTVGEKPTSFKIASEFEKIKGMNASAFFLSYDEAQNYIELNLPEASYIILPIITKTSIV